uniref:Uncharacterized protein n=2 Tax=Globodera rostochiensis TaxID=31243 RepID=A0A914H5C7_GLORO
MAYTHSASQKRKANTTTLSLYDSDEEVNVLNKKAHNEDGTHEGGSNMGFIPSISSTRNVSEAEKVCSANAPDSVLYSVCIERKGEREEMQDRHLVLDSFASFSGNFLLAGADDSQGVSARRCALYALFDGHAGRRAADYCAEHFAQMFVSVCKKYIPPKNALSAFERSIRKIFVETYKGIDDGFLTEARKQKPTMKDGTTATAIFLMDKTLYCANIGDSKAIVCRHKSEKSANIPLQLTVDHSPLVFDERMRIQKAGGTVKDGRVMGILEVSRTIGDGQMKMHGVICTPDLKKLSLTPDDLFIILACDGLWKVFTPETVVDFVADQYKSLAKNVEFIEEKDSAGLWTKIADEMSAEAVRKGGADCERKEQLVETVPVAEVNCDNLNIIWPQLIDSIKKAQLISIDLELSGLGERAGCMRTMPERYKRTREATRTRSILSVGIATFQFNGIDTDQRRELRYKCRVFDLLALEERPFVVEPEALQFLSSHGFDFNRVLTHGIRYSKTDSKGGAFHSLWEEIIASGVCIAFHNGLTDLAFLHEHFYAPLPELCDQFVANLADWFGEREATDDYYAMDCALWDSKYLAEHQQAQAFSCTYLDYVFRKAQRDNQRFFQNEKPHLTVKFAKLRRNVRQVTKFSQLNCGLKESFMSGNLANVQKQMLCQSYALKPSPDSTRSRYVTVHTLPPVQPQGVPQGEPQGETQGDPPRPRVDQPTNDETDTAGENFRAAKAPQQQHQRLPTSFLKGKPGLDGQGFRRYGSRLSPDANGECPLICPPCEELEDKERMPKGISAKGRRQRRLADEHSAELRVPLGECNTRRDRMANPPGMQVSFTIVVSFHSNFITRVDRAYNIQCAYQEPERLLSAQIDVSSPPIIQISNQMEAPQCEYRIHGQSSADQVLNVRVGDMVEHEWLCHGREMDFQSDSSSGERMAQMFGLLVHDCFVDDGKSRREKVVDSKGCSKDPLILPTPKYSPNSLRASILSSVAKFPDGDLVGFQCSITVCMRDLGKCDGFTPPNCSENGPFGSNVGENHSIQNRTKRSPNVERMAKSMGWELNSPLMTVFDLAEGAEEATGDGLYAKEKARFRQPLYAAWHNLPKPSAGRIPTGHSFSQMCVSLPLFALLISASTFLVTVSAGTLFVTLIFRDSLSPNGTKH